MKHAAIAAFVAMLIATPLGGAADAADIFWNPQKPPDASAELKKFDESFKPFPSTPAKSLEQSGIYDTPPSRVTPSEPERIRRVPRPITRTRPMPPPRRPIRQPERRQEQPTETAPPTVQEQPKPTSRPSDQPPEQRDQTPIPSLSEEKTGSDQDKTGWGQVQVKPAEPKPKLKWGQPQQQ